MVRATPTWRAIALMWIGALVPDAETSIGGLATSTYDNDCNLLTYKASEGSREAHRGDHGPSIELRNWSNSQGDEKATSPMAYWLAWKNLAQSETLCT